VSKNIYNNGRYIDNNPTLHEEDYEYKAAYLKELLSDLTFERKDVCLLDIGGGGGFVANMVCHNLASRGYRVECHAMDLSQEMLDIQQKNNPYLTMVTTESSQVQLHRYDLTMLIDVIEHVEDNDKMASMVNGLSKYVLYNIPTEHNLFDLLRNLYTGGKYYQLQQETLGHLHFYSYPKAISYVKKHHQMIKWLFPNYSLHLLASTYVDHMQQKRNKLRKIELYVSSWIYRRIKFIAPYVIQGSLFVLAECKEDET
jgi:cyclopropane fatty-acyl-phospholipid synthase-like methyltransferase